MTDTPEPISKDTKTLGELEDYFHYQLVCVFCGNTWWGLHCPHDGYQNPCPNCHQKPITIHGDCKCELVAPVDLIATQTAEAYKKGYIDGGIEATLKEKK